MTKYTDEELSMLLPEEREAYDEGQDFDEGQPQAASASDTTDGANTADETPIVVNDDGDDNADEDGKKPDTASAEAASDQDAADTDAATAAKADVAAATQDDGADDAQPVRRPLTMTQLPEDYEDQVTKIGTDKDALVAEFDEGDLTMAEYHKQLDALNRKERELERIKDRVDYETRAAADHWVNVDVAGFLAKHTEYNDNPMLLQLLDAEVQKLQRAASGEQFDPAYLTKAHKTIAEGMPAMFSQASTPAAKDAKRKIPNVPSLANIPAADVDRPSEGKFDVLDRLADSDPLAFELALDKMSAAEREEYLAS